MTKHGIQNPHEIQESVDAIVSDVYGDIFDDELIFWQPSGREEVCKAILKEYYMREIGFETYGLWKLRINNFLSMRQKFYIKAHAQLEKFLPLENINVTETRDTDGTDTRNKSDVFNEKTKSIRTDTGETSSNVHTDSSGTETEDRTNYSYDKYSDTPQNGLESVQEGRYLTSANMNDEGLESSGTTTGNTTTNASNNSKLVSDGTVDKGHTLGQDESGTFTEDEKKVRQGFMGDSVDAMEKFMEGEWALLQRICKDVAPFFMGIIC